MTATPTSTPPLTTWGAALDPDAPLPEYPRPQLVRDGYWAGLNGRWSYAMAPLRAGAADPLAVDDPTAPPAAWDGEIIVPFAPETVLSGVGRTLTPAECLWYRRTVTVPRAPVAGERVLLHFGAVDQTCRVAVDGVEVGGHTGGYLPFTFDVTDALDPARTAHELVVAVRDVTDRAWLTRGKQSTTRGGIWYSPQSGIWQTVWLEIVPAQAIARLDLTPDLPAGEVEVTVVLRPDAGGAGADAGSARATVEVSDADGTVVATADVPVGVPTRVALAARVRAWSPEDPHLYDVVVTAAADRVRSYVGMRSFGVGVDARGHRTLLLNGEPYLPVGLLDQGYWSDGGYTAPSDEALAYDVRLARDLGFTMLRKHIKVEPARWYHHCDRLGMLVWQDAVNGGGRYRKTVVTAPVFGAPQISDRHHRLFARGDEAGRASFEAELDELVAYLRNVPSLALWVPFNEGWGQFDAARIARRVAQIDPTRPVDHASGWHDQRAGDLKSLHVYFRRFRMRPRWARDGRVVALTEYGGYGLVVPGHQWGPDTWVYRRYDTADALTAAFEALHDDEIAPAVAVGLGATVYTQLSDVEDEVNGMVTCDRRVVKLDEARVRAANDRLRAAFAARAGTRTAPKGASHDRA